MTAWTNPDRDSWAPYAWLILLMIAIGAVKSPLGLPPVFRVFALVGAAIFLLTHLKVHRALLPAYGLVLIGAGSVLVDGLAIEAPLRLLQLVLMISLAHFVALQDEQRFLKVTASVLVPVSIAVLLLEILVTGPQSTRELIGIQVPRFSGIAGHHNHNALLGCFLALLALRARKLGVAAFFFSIALLASSRGVSLALMVALLAYLLRRAWSFRLFYWACVITIVTLPVWLKSLDAVLPEDWRLWLTIASSKRYIHWLTYVDMGLQNPLFGVGYFNGKEVYSQYAVQLLADFERAQQAHNFFIDVWAEFGLAGYAMIAFLVIRLSAVAEKHAPDICHIWLYVLVSFVFYDGISEWVFWVSVGYVWMIARQNKPGSPGSRTSGVVSNA